MTVFAANLIKKGRVEGLEEGLEKGRAEFIVKMIQKGYSKEEILELVVLKSNTRRPSRNFLPPSKKKNKQTQKR